VVLLIDYALIRNIIVKNLRLYLLSTYPNIDVVPQDEAHPKKTYPFVAYKFINTYNPTPYQDNVNVELVPSSDLNFQYDIKHTRVEQPTLTLSITGYSKDNEEAAELALQCHAWFDFIGDDIFEAEGIVAVDISNIQDRRTLIVDDYEQRQGFDVILRVTSKIEKTVPTIETVKIKEE
jgi:hypothetical protein